MSSVRMCDRCGNVFSERADNWGTFQGTTMRKDEQGRQRPVTETLDLCGSCNSAPVEPAGLAQIPSVAAAERLADVHHGEPATIVGER